MLGPWLVATAAPDSAVPFTVLAVIASLLQVKHLVLCVNKMDLVDYDQLVFDRISEEFREWAGKLDITDLTFIPVSALQGDNVTDKSPNMPWYDGPTLLHTGAGALPVRRDGDRHQSKEQPATPEHGCTMTRGGGRDKGRSRVSARRAFNDAKNGRCTVEGKRHDWFRESHTMPGRVRCPSVSS